MCVCSQFTQTIHLKIIIKTMQVLNETNITLLDSKREHNV